MWLVALLCVLGAALVYAFVPAKLFVGRIDAESWRAIGRHPVLLRVVSVTAIHASAQFALFSYLVIAYRDALAISPNEIAIFLCLTGIAGFCGNVFAGGLADRIGTPPVIHGAITMMLASFVLWLGVFMAGPGWLGLSIATLAALLWGAGNFASNSMQQVRLVNLAPPLASVSVALNTSAIYLGQFIGAGIGGLVLTHATMAPASSLLPWVGLPVFLVALWVSTRAQRRADRLAHASVP
jgi:predicted MFS family arabinose efflux permease